MNEPVDRPHLSDETLSLRLDGELDPSGASEVAEHVSACATCAARHDALAAAAEAVRAAVVEPPSELDARRLIDRALEERVSMHSRSRASWARSWWEKARSAPAIPALAAIVLAVLVATGLLSYDRPSGDQSLSGDAESRSAGAVLSDEAFLGDLGDLDTLTDAESLAFLDGASSGTAAAKMLPRTDPEEDETGETTTTAEPPNAAQEKQGAAPDRFTATDPDPQASPEEEADILQCAETIELSARSSDLTEEEADRPLTWRLELAATGRLEGKDALFLAFERPGGGLQIFLVRRDDCSIVRFLTSPLAPPR